MGKKDNITKKSTLIHSVPELPERRDYQNIGGHPSLANLPFVYRPKRGFKNACNWNVAPIDNYGLACEIGREYAAHFCQYIKDNPSIVGMPSLGDIVADMDFSDETSAKGYFVGFFAHLERFIYAGCCRVDVFADLDSMRQWRDAQLAARQKEKAA